MSGRIVFIFIFLLSNCIYKIYAEDPFIYEFSYGSNNGMYNGKVFNNGHTAINANLVFSQDYSKYFGGFLSKQEFRSDDYRKKVAFKIPISLQFSSIDVSNPDISRDLWGLSTGLTYQTGYCSWYDRESSFDLLNHYSIGFSYHFLNDYSGNADVYNRSLIPMVANSIEGFSILDETGSGISYRYKRVGFDFTVRNIQNIKSMILPQWLGTKVIDLGINEITDLYLVYIFNNYEEFLPVFNFLLKFGINYLLSDLKTYHKHWPFDSGPSYSITSYSMGFSLNVGDYKW